jgi:2-amino-4-hydroxy-6-hydroxymethyldihydropteridine diphosphokinase
MSQVTQSIEKTNVALIAVGSNAQSRWGDAFVTVQYALDRLKDQLDAPLHCSPLYQTPAFPVGAGPDFVNGAVAVETAKSPAEILAILHEIESSADRTREVRWGQRTLDLDLIACGQSILPDIAGFRVWLDLEPAEQQLRAPTELILPHPRMQDRAFVLGPLSDIAPDWMHPILGLSVADMLACCTPEDRASVRLPE